MTDKIVVLTTVGSPEEADRIARDLVEHHLAACVNLLPGMKSVYRWQGKVETEAEILLLIKTERGRFDEVQREIQRVHSYAVPEIVALPVVDGLPAYLDWIAHSVTAPSAQNGSESLHPEPLP